MAMAVAVAVVVVGHRPAVAALIQPLAGNYKIRGGGPKKQKKKKKKGLAWD